MEGVDHVDVIEICRGSLVSEVDGVLQRQIPDGEGFKLGVACIDAALVLMVKLGKAGGHFSAAGARSGYHDQRTGGFNIIIFSEAVF